jgi:cyclophilin family peptidyl-prolyl cis-trans isomerase
MFKKLPALTAIAALTSSLLLSAGVWAAPSVELQTSMGLIVIELNSEKAPKTVQNFLQYTKDGFYNGTIFHRVIDGFMIQGGGFAKDMEQKSTGPQIVNEARNGLKNERGTVAMARRAEPHSATAQFFINHKDNTMLDYTGEQDGRSWGYAVFGKVTQGMDVVDKIAKVPTGGRAIHQNVPLEPIVIQSVKVIPDPNASAKNSDKK